MSNWLPNGLRHGLILAAILLFCGLGAYELYKIFKSTPKIDPDNTLQMPVNSASTGHQDSLKTDPTIAGSGSTPSSKPRQSSSLMAPLFAENSTNNELSICGLSQAEAAQVRAAPNTLSLTHASIALAQPIQQRLQSSAPTDNALGLYLQVLRANWLALDSAAQERQNNPCQDSASCANNQALALQKSLAHTTQTTVAPLVKLALTKGDPITYATAVYACNLEGAREPIEDEKTGTVTQPPCAAINLAQWATIDSDNAVPWLMLAAQPSAAVSLNANANTNASATSLNDTGEAQQKREQAVIEMAISRAVAANNYNRRFPALTTLFDEASVRALSPFAQAALANEFLGQQHTLTASLGIAQYCAAPHYGTEKRRLYCSAIANKLVLLDSSLTALQAATAMGKSLNWDSARINALRDERLAITQLLNEKVASNIKLNCENIAALNTHLQNLLRHGERTVGHELLTASGKTASQIMTEDAHK